MRADSHSSKFVSRGGDKLAAAIDHFRLDISGLVCCDLGSHTGGFLDCLLQCGAAKVYSVDTSYGTLAWKLRRDPRVVVRERTNAMHVELPEPVDLVTIDLGWTCQSKVLPNVERMIAAQGNVLTLIKPHYEAPKEALKEGVLPDEIVDSVVQDVLGGIKALGWEVLGVTNSPIRGHAGNMELFALLARLEAGNHHAIPAE